MIQSERMTKVEYYLNIAETVSKRSTCLRRNYGAVIVNNDQIISTGYNGSHRGNENCNELGHCERQKLNIPSGERYELCESIHAEQNAIISAARKDMIGSTLYLAGFDHETSKPITSLPCKLCRRMIINAGIEKVVCLIIDKETNEKSFTVFYVQKYTRTFLLLD